MLETGPNTGIFRVVTPIATSEADAEIGGTVDYQVTVRNVAPIVVNNIQITDLLPRGFTFVPNSARRQNAATAGGTPGIAPAVPDPNITNVRDLTFNVGTVAAGESGQHDRQPAIYLDWRRVLSGRLHHFDCAAFNLMHTLAELEGRVPYDTIRAAFSEGGELFPGSGFRQADHTQICVRNLDCVLGYFRPL